MLRTIFALIVISLFAAVGPAQTKVEDYNISPRDKAELQRLAKRFVRRMQLTRDVGPLMQEFFLNDLDLLFDRKLFWSDDFDATQLTRSQWQRAYVAFSNRIYMTQMSDMLNGSDEFSNILPSSLASALEEASLDQADWPGQTTKSEILTRLRNWEKSFTIANSILKRRNYERSAAYMKVWRERVRSESSNYSIRSEMLWDPKEPDPEVPSAVIERFREGLRAFYVSTPANITLILVKEHSRFKIILIGIYPMD
jgi:hypothetical protein